jgi:hypothetical protein
MTLFETDPVFGPVLAAVSSYDPIEHRAMACNFLAEDRLPIARFNAVKSRIGAFADFAAMKEKIDDYYFSEVRPTVKSGRVPDYLRAENASNEVNFPVGTDLATVLDLTGLGQVYFRAKQDFGSHSVEGLESDGPTLSEVFRGLSNKASLDEINRFLASKFDGVSNRETMAAILDALRLARNFPSKEGKNETLIFHTWAATWNSLQPFLSDRPDAWLQAVGVPKQEARWVAVIRYPASRTKVFKPTQIDAGWFTAHFPTPPEVHCGHTMHLTHPVEPPSLVAEYIHQQIDFRVDDWAGFVGPTSGPVHAKLLESRENHWNLLQSHYGGPEILKWMPRFA